MTWQPDLWYQMSEQFYEKAIVNGVCQYCGKDVGPSPIAVCECKGLVAARTAFKDRIYREAGQTPPAAHYSPPVKRSKPKPEYNPNAYIEPEERGF